MIRSVVFLIAALVSASASAAGTAVELYRNPNCGCCEAHAEYLRGHGFDVEVIASEDLASIKSRHGVTRQLAACHTALIDGYVVEGHVPVDSIERLLEERPDVAGIAVPGMPVGSPGMGMERGLKEPLRVWTIPSQSGDQPALYATYRTLPANG